MNYRLTHHFSTHILSFITLFCWFDFRTFVTVFITYANIIIKCFTIILHIMQLYLEFINSNDTVSIEMYTNFACKNEMWTSDCERATQSHWLWMIAWSKVCENESAFLKSSIHNSEFTEWTHHLRWRFDANLHKRKCLISIITSGLFIFLLIHVQSSLIALKSNTLNLFVSK